MAKGMNVLDRDREDIRITVGSDSICIAGRCGAMVAENAARTARSQEAVIADEQGETRGRNAEVPDNGLGPGVEEVNVNFPDSGARSGNGRAATARDADGLQRCDRRVQQYVVIWRGA